MNILLRKSFCENGEYEAANRYARIFYNRSDVQQNSLVVGRYSVLPYYSEVEYDLKKNGSYLINNNAEHNWIANFDWYNELKNYTFESWDDQNFHLAPEQAYVIKGVTNSRKDNWNKYMFADSKKSALNIASLGVIDQGQNVIYRRYVPLEHFEIGINGVPFANEWRLFYFRQKLLCSGYYWSQSEFAESKNAEGIPTEAIELANEVAAIASQFTNFFVLDVAKTIAGDWLLVEINDGQMSGLSMCDPDELYKNLKSAL